MPHTPVVRVKESSIITTFVNQEMSAEKQPIMVRPSMLADWRNFYMKRIPNSK